MIDELMIKRFRGINNLNCKGLKRINFIFGKNNVGKTSFLESLRFLSLGFRIDSISRIARCRDRTMNFAPARFERMLSLFPYDDPREGIEVEASFQGWKYFQKISDAQIMVRYAPMQGFSTIGASRKGDARENPIDGLEGTISNNMGEKRFAIDDSMNLRRDGAELFPSTFLGSYDHLSGSVLQPFLEDDGLMKRGLDIAKAMDPAIETMAYGRSRSGRAIDTIKLKDGHILPLSYFGEGLRKALFALGGIAKSRGGILLIDEFDDALHLSMYEGIVKAFAEACEHYDTQIIATTHRSDLLDVLASFPEDDKTKEAISLVTLRKISGRIGARVLGVDEALSKRVDFGFEVRE